MTKENYDPEAALVEWCALRQELLLSQPEVAALLGVTRLTISHWECRVSPVPLWALRFLRMLAGQQQSLPLLRAKPPKAAKRTRRKQWTRVIADPAFVLVQVMPPDAQCWHATTDELAVLGPNACQGTRAQFTCLIPPTARQFARRAKTVTCEKHATAALFSLQKNYTDWMRRVFRRPQRNWYRRWSETLHKYEGDEPRQPRKAVNV